MDTRTLPSLFVSHGSPMIALEPGAAGAFLGQLGRTLEAQGLKPRAVLALSAHTLAGQNVVLGAAQHETVHDFGGFPEALYALRYDAPGDPELARTAGQLLQTAGLPTRVLPQGGLDHGIWTALRYLLPAADVPVVPVAINPHASPQAQFALGQALAPLRAQGVLVLGTGSITHNLQRVMMTRRFHAGIAEAEAMPEIAESAAFRQWVLARSQARDWEALFDYRRQAPHAADMHPSDEHWLPFYSAAGAGGREARPQRLHDSLTFGCLGMDTYAFGPEALPLAQALAGSAREVRA
jgi:4,5-DOPA dioxygenase extradiol